MSKEQQKLKIIARIQTDFPAKFGIPRQSGMVEELKGKIVFDPEYRNPEAVRGLEGFSHIWLIWEFSEAKRDEWSPTVRPPRLGGNVRKGVFATRSPFRPNPIGLSAVKLCKVEIDAIMGPVLHVSGADLMDGTPIYDIKPYIPFADSYPVASSGFINEVDRNNLKIIFPDELLDPRPSYQNDAERIYGLSFAGFDVRFKVENELLTVCGVVKI